MKNHKNFCLILLLILSLPVTTLCQQTEAILQDSNYHVITYAQHGILWGRVFNQNNAISLNAYRSIIQTNQPQAVHYFEQYQSHLKKTKISFLTFGLLCLVTSISAQAARRDGNSTRQNNIATGFAIGATTLVGFSLYQRNKAQKQLKASVHSIKY